MGVILRAALLGSEIQESLSPRLHEAAARSVGGRASYNLIDVTAERVHGAVEELAAQGIHGWNVTAPHKEFVASWLGELSPTAERLGVVNTVIHRGHGTPIGDNTDVHGFKQLLGDWSGERAVVLGAGGAARAVVDVLSDVCGELEIINRSPETARMLQERLAPRARVSKLSDLEVRLRGAELFVNTTGVCLQGRLLELPFAAMSPQATVLDLSYGSKARPVLESASLAGCVVRDGLEMLIGQGIRSFELWTGRQPSPSEVRKALYGISDLQR